jgi:ABC-type branched-subunit amino acid transport system substrate-binding protein
MRGKILIKVFVVLTAFALSQTAAAESVKMTTQGITESEILLGTHQDLSGPIAAIGRIYKDTMIMRINEINEAGGIHGRKLRLIVEDTGYDPKKAVLATQKLLTKDKVFALVGTFGTPTSLVSRPLALEKGIPFMFPGSGNVVFHTPTHPLSFGYFLPDEFFLSAGLNHVMKTIKPKSVGVIYQDDEYGDAVVDGASMGLEKYGMKIKEKASFKRGATDFSSQVRRLKAAGVELVVLGTALRETIGTAKEKVKQGWDVQLLGGFPPYNPFTIAIGKEAVEGLIAAGQNQIFYEDTAPPEIVTWLKKWKSQCKGLPGISAAAAYNYVSLVAMGLEATGRDITVKRFIKGMESITFQDIFGTPPTTFSPTNHLTARKVFLAQVRNGRWERLTDWVSE